MSTNETQNTPLASWENGGDEPWHGTICTDQWIDEKFDEHERLTEKFRNTEFEDTSTHFDDGRQFMESQGYFCHARDNTYNSENELSGEVVWEVWTKKEHEHDWVWADDAVCVLYCHRGGDVRGNYGGPLFLEHNGDYSMALDWVCGFHIEEGVDSDGESLQDGDCRQLDEHWQIGYSSSPFCAMEESVREWVEFDEEQSTWKAVLTTGETVWIGVHGPY
jgi:hypothetical protein